MGEKTRKLVCQPDVAALDPEALARRYEFFPLRCSGGVLKVAVAKPLSGGPRYAAVRRRTRDQQDPPSRRGISAIGI